MGKISPAQSDKLFNNTFQISDLSVFDKDTWQAMFHQESNTLKVADLALALKGTDKTLIEKVTQNLPFQKMKTFWQTLSRPASKPEIDAAHRRILDKFFWELTYWKTPELYEELTEGEHLHPGIFQSLKSDIEGKVVLDAGAGSGRASLECLRFGAKQIYAVEPSTGLLNILKHKLHAQKTTAPIVTRSGRFNRLPVPTNSVDLALSCSAFTAEPEQGGEPGLRELIRVTRPGGKVVIIWPRRQDLQWLAQHGFQHESLPLYQEMKIRFRDMHSALRCANHFYKANPAVKQHLLKEGRPELPFSVLGINPPHDYCWLKVAKD